MRIWSISLCLGLLPISGCAGAPIAGVVKGEDTAALHRVFVQVTLSPQCNDGSTGTCDMGDSDAICEVISDSDGQFSCSSLRGQGDAKVRLKPEQTYQVRFEKEGYKTHCYCVTYDRELSPHQIELPYRSSSISPRSWPTSEPAPPAPDAPSVTTQGG